MENIDNGEATGFLDLEEGPGTAIIGVCYIKESSQDSRRGKAKIT